MWKKRTVDKVELIEGGVKTTEEDGLVIPLGTLEKPYQTCFTATVLGSFIFSTQRDFSISVDHCLLCFFSLVPFINGSVYYCYHASVPPLCICCACDDGGGGQIAYRLIHRSLEHKELYSSLMEGLDSV